MIGVSLETRSPGNWIRRLSRTGRWQTTYPRRTSADQQSHERREVNSDRNASEVRSLAARELFLS